MAISYKKTAFNGTRSPSEGRDCAVRALMTAASSTYEEAAEALRKSCGRRVGGSTNTSKLMKLLDTGRVLGKTFTRVHSSERVWKPSGRRGQIGTMSIAAFIKQNPKGTFYVLKAQHAMVVVDGVLVDVWQPGPRCRVTFAWRVTTTSKAIIGQASTCAALDAAEGVPFGSVRRGHDAEPKTLDDMVKPSYVDEADWPEWGAIYLERTKRCLGRA